MNPSEIAAVVGRLTYKPNTKISVRLSPTEEMVTFWYSATVQDVRDSQLKGVYTTIVVNLTREVPIEIVLDEDWIKWFVTDLVRDAEMHEMKEWLRLDGRCLVEPHPREP